MDEDLLAYYRELNDKRLLIVLNLTDRPQALRLEEGAHARILVSTRAERDGERVPGTATIVGDEGLVIDLASR